MKLVTDADEVMLITERGILSAPACRKSAKPAAMRRACGSSNSTKATGSSPWRRSIRKRGRKKNPETRNPKPEIRMTNQIRNPNDETVFVRYFCLIGASIAGSAICWWAAGNSLGLFFGGLFIATFLAPAAVLGRRKVVPAMIGLAAVAGPVAAVWLAAVFRTHGTIAQWFETIWVLSAMRWRSARSLSCWRR